MFGEDDSIVAFGANDQVVSPQISFGAEDAVVGQPAVVAPQAPSTPIPEAMPTPEQRAVQNSVASRLDAFRESGGEELTHGGYSLPADIGGAAKEAPKGIYRGIQQVEAAIGSGIEAIGDYLDTQQKQFRRIWENSPLGQRSARRKREAYIQQTGELPPDTLTATPRTAGEATSDFGQFVYDFWNEAANTGWEKRDPEIYGGTFRENPSIARVVGGAAESAPTMLGALTLSAAGQPGMGVALLSATEALPSYTEAKRMGASEGDAFSYALISGVGTAALERVGINSILGRNPAVNALVEKMGQNWVAGALVNFAVEGSQEAVQEMWQNAVAMGYDEDRSVFENALEAGITGGVLGSGSSVGVDIMRNYVNQQSQRVNEAPPEEIDRAVLEAMRPENAQMTQVDGEIVPAQTEEEANAVQVEQAAEVPARQEAQAGEEVGQEVRREGEAQKVTDTEPISAETPIAPQDGTGAATEQRPATEADQAVSSAEPAVSPSVGVESLGRDELRARAEELGVSFNPRTPMEELRRNVRQAQSGGFVGVALATEKPSEEQSEFIKQQRENDKKVHEWHQQQRKNVASLMRAQLVDRQGDVKKALENVGADDAVQRLVLKSGASSEAAIQFRDAEKQIMKMLPAQGMGRNESMTYLKDYIAAMRVIEATQVQAARGIELKSPISAEAAKTWVNDTFNNLPAAQRDAIMEAAQIYWRVADNQLAALRAEGLLSEEGYNAIRETHKFYSPRRFVEYIDPISLSPRGERSHDSGIKPLDEGSESAMAQDPMYLMAHIITRAQSRIFENRANRALYDLAVQEDNGIVRVLDRKATTEDGQTTYSFEEPNRDEGVVRVYIDGNEVRMAMDSRLAQEWNGLSPELSKLTASILQWGSGTRILKALATGANPEFAISNIPRDAFYSWFVSGQYNSVLPVGLMQLGADYTRVMRDAVSRSGAYRDYIREGGGMDFLTTQGMTRKPRVEGGRRIWRQIGDILAWAGETSEIATRLAVRNRAIENGSTPEEATFIARNMLDFAQGGTFTKAADNVIPYLNAAFQGTRGGFRAFKTNPKLATFKAAQLAAIGYGMAYFMASLFPEMWDSIPEREKATKWIIPLGKEPVKDRNGNSRYRYLAIAKDQFQQIFSAIGQSFSDAESGRPWSDQIISSIQSITPVDVNAQIPIIAAKDAYFNNYDAWTREDVWRGYDIISADKEVTAYTPKIAKDISEAALRAGIRISPERLATATTKIIPQSNPIGGLFSTLYESGTDSSEIDKTMVERVQATPGLRRLMRFTRPVEIHPSVLRQAERLEVDVDGMTDLQARKAVENAERDRADARQPMNVEMERWLLEKDNRSPAKLRSWLRDNIDSQEERARLYQRARLKYPNDIKTPYKPRRSAPRRDTYNESY